MTTEAKIRAEYERITTASGFEQTVSGFIMFKTGYMALLNELEDFYTNMAAARSEK